MQTIDASKFKQRCLSVLENLDAEGIVVTKNGKPLARVLPITSDCADLIGSMEDKIKIHGNILSTSMKWDVES